MEFQDYFKAAIDNKSSDLHLIAGNKPVLRTDGELNFLNSELIEHKFLEESLVKVLEPSRLKEFRQNKELDFSYQVFGHRFRVNLHYQENMIGLSARLIQLDAPRPEQVGFTDPMMNLTRLKDGLILVPCTLR